MPPQHFLPNAEFDRFWNKLTLSLKFNQNYYTMGSAGLRLTENLEIKLGDKI